MIQQVLIYKYLRLGIFLFNFYQDKNYNQKQDQQPMQSGSVHTSISLSETNGTTRLNLRHGMFWISSE